MDIYKQKFTSLQNEIFRLLCVKVGEILNQRQIAKILRVSPTAVAKALPLLKKEGLILHRKLKEMNLNYVEIDRGSEIAMQLKRVENLKMIYESGLVKYLERSFPGATISLFGSFSRGDDTSNSDIDIAIIGSKEKKVDLRKFEEGLKKEIIINFYSSFKEINKELKENILRGIVLIGVINL